jgi:hypothetical protein
LTTDGIGLAAKSYSLTLSDPNLPPICVGDLIPRAQLPLRGIVGLSSSLTGVGKLFAHDVKLREHHRRLLGHDVVLKIGRLPLQKRSRATAERDHRRDDGDGNRPPRPIRDLLNFTILLLVGVGLSAAACAVLWRWGLRLLSVTAALLLYTAVFVVLLHAIRSAGRLYEFFLG